MPFESLVGLNCGQQEYKFETRSGSIEKKVLPYDGHFLAAT